MQIDLTQGPITRTMLRFAVPMICGNLLQQLYNVVDTLIVGQYLGANDFELTARFEAFDD